MSCYLCHATLEFHEIAGFNPNLPANDSERTNFCWEDEAGTKATPICDECYWAPDRSEEPEYENTDEEEDEDENIEEEEEPIPIYSFCRICNEVIKEISPIGLTDEELDAEMFTHICYDCIENPVTPPITSHGNASPSDEQAGLSPWSQP